MTWARRAVRSLEDSSLPSSSDRARTGALLREHHPESSGSTIRSTGERFKRVSWKDLAATLEREPAVFRDRLVFVGGDFVGFGGDYHRVPARADAPPGVSGLVLQALIANTIALAIPGSRARAVSRICWVQGWPWHALMLTFLLSAAVARSAVAPRGDDHGVCRSCHFFSSGARKCFFRSWARC